MDTPNTSHQTPQPDDIAGAAFEPPACSPYPPEVLDELQQLFGFVKRGDREIAALRFGLDGHLIHNAEQMLALYGVPVSKQRATIKSALFRMAAAAWRHDTPALTRLLGTGHHAGSGCLARAWDVTCEIPARSRATHMQLLLAVNRFCVEDLVGIVDRYLREIGVRENTVVTLSRDTKHAQAPERARELVDRLLKHTIWPSNPPISAITTLDHFSCQRQFSLHAPSCAGYFTSPKLGRAVQHDSLLELQILRAFDLDPRVVDYQEQPFTIPVAIDEQAHHYTPDVIVQLDDRRVLVVEAKPPTGFGQFTDWLRWASLARWCHQHHAGLYIGGPEISILDHYTASQNARVATELRDEITAVGVLDRAAYIAFSNQHDTTTIDIAQAATKDLLDWRHHPTIIRLPEGDDAHEAQAFWNLIAHHASHH